ncbi:hypothetical protein ANCCAN_27409, partial [Ancylostoma caninum]
LPFSGVRIQKLKERDVNFFTTSFQYEDPDSFPSSVDPSGSSSDHATGGMQPSSGSSGSTSGVVPPATSPTIPVTPTSIVPHIQRSVLNSANNLQHALGNYGGWVPLIQPRSCTFHMDIFPAMESSDITLLHFRHIKLNLYQCAVCQKTWQTIAKSDVLKHVKAIHNGDESMIIDNRKRLGYQLRMFTARCFPPKPSNKAKPLTAGCSPPRPGAPSSDPDFGTIHSESASQILQSFIGAGGNNPVNVPKEEPDMDHEEVSYEYLFLECEIAKSMTIAPLTPN